MINNEFYVYAYVRNKDSITDETRKKLSDAAKIRELNKKNKEII
jgi:hypothetical protein